MKPDESKVGSLQRKFIIPPFSIFNTILGYWQDRKKEWLSIGIKSDEGRDKEITYNISSQPQRVYQARNVLREKTGVDPTWDELIEYFLPKVNSMHCVILLLTSVTERWQKVLC